jgi:cytochrome c oxidase subunit III
MNAVTAPQQPQRIHPKMFAMWLAIASVIMLFAGLTSAFIVRSSAGNWINFRLPNIFWYTTAIIALSSVTMHWALVSYKKYNYTNYKIGILLTFLLGCAFAVGQYIGWFRLASIGVFVDGNPSGSFVYVISFVHLLHIMGGLVALLVALIRSLVKPYHPKRLLGVRMTATYWHFVDALWLYLFIFFQLKFMS